MYQPYWSVGFLGVFAVGCCVFAAGVGAVDGWAAGAFFVVENGVAVGAGAGFFSGGVRWCHRGYFISSCRY